VGQWTGSAAEAAAALSDDLHQRRGQLHAAHAGAVQVMSGATEISRDARLQMRAVESGWASDKAAIAPYAGTVSGQAALLQAGRQRVEQATLVVRTAADRFGGAAQQMSGLIGQLPQGGGPGGQPTVPAAPKPKDPPHGKDPRYWIDLDQLKYVPDGKLAPHGVAVLGGMPSASVSARPSRRR
jgi:hypothetical protein